MYLLCRLSRPHPTCRAKAEALAKAQADAERAERDAKHAAEAEARRLAEAEAALKATLERKRQALAAEPSASDANSVNVMVRAPLSRSFTRAWPRRVWGVGG